jgi:putative Mg2+ transporter-C (MgtC) family protein
MPEHVGWDDIALRLFLTVVAAAIIGAERGEHGRPAGLRTTLLVGLAAAISMIQVNLLMPIHGKAPDSFAVFDLMRLPLGILTGVGFIGAGAILRKDSEVLGVTTAATLWFVTVVGLCLGGGQIILGSVATALGLLVLVALKPLEKNWKRDQRASLTVLVGSAGLSQTEIAQNARNAGYKVAAQSVTHDAINGTREMRYRLDWLARPEIMQAPAFVAELAARPHTLKVIWQLA